LNLWKSFTDPETRIFWWWRCVDPSLHHFWLIHPCDRQTELRWLRRSTAGGTVAHKNWFVLFNVDSTILLSIISLLSEPNTSSPANVDASVAYRRWVESKGRDSFYEDIVRSVFVTASLFCRWCQLWLMSNIRMGM